MERPRLLIVDDDPRIGRLIGRVARRLGFAAEILMDDEQVQPVCQEEWPTVVVVDMVLGHRNGGDVIRTLAENRSRPMPVLVLISGADADRMATARALAQELGIPVSASLPKPLDVGILTRELRRAVEAAGHPDVQVA